MVNSLVRLLVSFVGMKFLFLHVSDSLLIGYVSFTWIDVLLIHALYSSWRM